MKTEKQFKTYIESVVKKYQPILLLQRHLVTVKKIEDDGYFNCLFNYPYLNVTIGFSIRALKDWQKGENKEREIVHEMCHMLTDPLYAKAITRYTSKQDMEDERERLTDVIANIVYKLVI
jgi:hypothetical protein